MKQKFLLYSIVFLLFSMISISALAGVPNLEITPPAQSVSLGSECTLNIEVQDVTDLKGASITLNFDASKLQYVSSVDGGFIPGAFLAPADVDNVSGTVLLDIVSLSSYASGSGNIVSVMFERIDGGNTNITFGATELRNKDNNTIPHSQGFGCLITFCIGDFGGPGGIPDNHVDFEDLMIFAMAYGSTPSDANWNPICDLYLDGKIDFEDLMIFAMHYGDDCGGCTLPSAPSLSDPGDTLSSPATYTVSWSSVSEADSYVLQEATSSDFTTGLLEYSLAGTSREFSHIITTNTNYYYRVVAINSCGQSSWSNVEDMEIILQDSGNKLFLESGGMLNETSINPTNPVLTVNAGESIIGTLKVQAIYSGPSGNVVPFGYTPSWGTHSSSHITVVGDLPVGTYSHDVSINLTAPATPGTYYLIFASNAEMNLGWTMSQTNWTTGSYSWDDGKDIADLTEPELLDSLSTGFLNLDMLEGTTYKKSNYGITYVKISVPPDSANKLFLESGGMLNETSINPTDPVLTVNAGESITGTLKVQAIYSGTSGNVVPFGYTPSWGTHSSSYVTVVSDLPVGTGSHDVSIDLTAPTTPGTYYLIFASNAEMNLGWTMSQTNWTTGSYSWDDGNDIADLTEPELQDSLSSGFLYLDMLTGSTYSKSNYGIVYVKINVGEAIIPETTEIIDEETEQVVTSVSEDQTTVVLSQSTPQTDLIDPGDIMVMGVTDQTPYGFLRRVTNVTRGLTKESQIVIDTEFVTLEEAVQEGSWQYHHSLKPEDIEKGYVYPKGIQPIQSKASTSLDFEYTISEILYDHDKDPETIDDNITATGYLGFNYEVIFDGEIDDYTLEYFIFKNIVTTDAELDISVGAAVSVSDLFGDVGDVTIGTPIPFAPITVWIPAPIPLPLVFYPTIELKVGLEGEAHIVLETGIQQIASYTAGLEFTNGNWQDISTTPQVNYYEDPVTVDASIHLNAHLGPQFNCKLYKVAGPYCNIFGYLDFMADINWDPWWDFNAGLLVSAGVKADILSIHYNSGAYELINLSVDIADAGGPFGGANNAPDIDSTPITDATAGVPYTYDVNATDPDPGDVLTFSLVENECPVGMTIDPVSGVINWTPTLGQLGDNPVIVEVSDDGSPKLSDTQSFTITVSEGSIPIISLTGTDIYEDTFVGQSTLGSLTISNTGTAPLNVTDINYSSSVFSGDWNGEIPAGDSQNVTVTFTPSEVTTYSCTITVNSNATSGTNTKSVSGRGVTGTPIISLSGDTSFSDVPVGDSDSTTLTISNTGTAPLNVTGINYSSSVFSGDWNGEIPAGDSQNVTVTFAPTDDQYYSGIITVNSNATIGINTKSVSGTGIIQSIDAIFTNVTSVPLTLWLNVQDTVYVWVENTGNVAHQFKVQADETTGTNFITTTQYIPLDPGDEYNVAFTYSFFGATGGNSRSLTFTLYTNSGEYLDTITTDPIGVSSGADLTVTALTSPSTASPGEEISVYWKMENSGTGVAQNVNYGIYLSTNSTITTSDDIELWDDSISYMEPGAGISDNTTVTIPSGTSSGNYYIGFLADTYDNVIETDETNNYDSNLININ